MLVENKGSELLLLASPWSPPSWMKVPIPTLIPTHHPTHVSHQPTLSPTTTTTNIPTPSILTSSPSLFPSTTSPSLFPSLSTPEPATHAPHHKKDIIDIPKDRTLSLEINVDSERDLRLADSAYQMTGSSQPNGLKDDARVMAAWAKYISLFIDSYAAHQISIWGVTPQNEPEFAAPWEACVYNASFEKIFIDEYLGPVLNSEHPDVCKYK